MNDREEMHVKRLQRCMQGFLTHAQDRIEQALERFGVGTCIDLVKADADFEGIKAHRGDEDEMACVYMDLRDNSPYRLFVDLGLFVRLYNAGKVTPKNPIRTCSVHYYQIMRVAEILHACMKPRTLTDEQKRLFISHDLGV